MKKILAFVLSIAVVFGMVTTISACTSETPIVGLICLHDESSTYDKNFIDAFEAACKAKGLKKGQWIIKTGVREEGSDCKDTAEQFVKLGCKAIFADSFGHEDSMLEVAKKHPEVQFCHATGVKAHTENLANFHNAFASIYEGRYLAGVAAGLKLQEMIAANKITDAMKEGENIKIGYVGAYPYAEVKSGYTSWFLGVRSIVPNVVMKVKFTNEWYSMEKERNTANYLISEQHCAIISQHADSMGAPNACEAAEVPNVSYNGSTAASCPKTFIVSSRINWQPYFELMIDAVTGGKDLPTDWTGNISTGSVVLTELGAAAAANTQAKIDEVKAKLLNGSLKVFDLSTFTVNGAALVDNFMANVNDDAAFTPDTVVIKTTESGIKYFAESEFRSAPYFEVDIDGITIIANN